MDLNIQLIEKLLHSDKKVIRKANGQDISLIKNELFALITEDSNQELTRQMKHFLNNLHYFTVWVEKEDENSIVYYYEPNKRAKGKILKSESGWIEIVSY